MSRISTSETITVRPTNNVYTALLGMACVVAVVALAILFIKGQELIGTWQFT
jgi:hypothetical protein